MILKDSVNKQARDSCSASGCSWIEKRGSDLALKMLRQHLAPRGGFQSA